MRRRRGKRKRPKRLRWDADANMVAYRAFTPGVLGSIPRRPIFGVLTQLGSVPGSYPGSSGFDSLAPHVLSPRSSVESEHLATDQGVVGSNPTAEVLRVVSSAEREHVASTHGVEGSNPSRPVRYGRLAQPGRALALQARCRRFDSCTAHLVSQPDKCRPPTGASENLGGASMRVWLDGRAAACRAAGMGSIPVIRLCRLGPKAVRA